MRKVHALTYVALLSIFFLLSSCKKDFFVGNDITKPAKTTELTIGEAQSYFTQSVSNIRYNKRANVRTAVFQQMADQRKVLWDKATLTRTSKGATVKVPIDLGNVKMRLQDVGVLSYDKLNYLMMYKDSAHVIHAEWVFFLPEVNWLKGDRKQYKGKIKVGNWAGELLKEYRFNTVASESLPGDKTNFQDSSLHSRDMLSAASASKIIAVCFLEPHSYLNGFDPCTNKANWDGVCDNCSICKGWTCFNTTDMTPIDIDDPAFDPGMGGSGSSSTGSPSPIYVYGGSNNDGGDYAPGNCNPDPNYKVPNTPPPAGMEWVLPCGEGPAEVPLPVPANPVTSLALLTQHLEITDDAQITYLTDHGDVQEGLINFLRKNPSEERIKLAKELLTYFLANPSITWGQAVELSLLDLPFINGPRICISSFKFGPQTMGSDVNRAQIWGIPAFYKTTSNEMFSLVFGTDNYAPGTIKDFGMWNKFASTMQYDELWKNGDIWKRSNGTYGFSIWAQKKIFADATDFASYWASEKAKEGVTADEYKKEFKKKLTDWLNNYYPGASILMLNSTNIDAWPCKLTDGDPELCP